MVFRHDSKKVSIDRTQFLQFSINGEHSNRNEKRGFETIARLGD